MYNDKYQRVAFFKAPERFCNTNPKESQKVNKWLKLYERFWNDKLVNLVDYLDFKVQKKKTH